MITRPYRHWYVDWWRYILIMEMRYVKWNKYVDIEEWIST